MEEPYTVTTAQDLLMLVTSLVTHCCGMASYSSTSICCKSANVVVLVCLAQKARQAKPTSVQSGQGQDCWQAIPSDPLPNSGGILLETPLCWGGRCHLGG